MVSGTQIKVKEIQEKMRENQKNKFSCPATSVQATVRSSRQNLTII